MATVQDRRRLKKELTRLFASRQDALRRLELVTVFAIDCRLKKLYELSSNPRNLILFLVNGKDVW